MTTSNIKCCVLLLVLFLAGARSASAAIALDTVNWAPDSSVDGTGTGVLDGTTVTYTTAIGFNAGETFSENWPSYTGTMAASSVTFKLGGVFGGALGGTVETVTFSSSIVNPILLVNFLGGPPGGGYAADFFDFGSTSFTLLSSFNATASGNTVSSTTAVTDSANDGFAIQLNGTFGSSTPLQFDYSSNGTGPDNLQTVAFTIGTPTATPEPSSLIVWCGLGAIGLFTRRRFVSTAVHC